MKIDPAEDSDFLMKLAVRSYYHNDLHLPHNVV